MKKLFPPIRPFKTEMLKVSSLHSLYLEQSGNPKGKPVISFHGGPGSKSKADHRRFYNPEKYRIILFDQRGCGKSIPLGELKENTTTHLVYDIEKIRKHLCVDRWVIHGGSWGSTLALAYAETYPKTITALLLRGIFTFRKWEINWFTKNARLFFPDLWDQATKVIPKNIKNTLNEYLYGLYTGNKKRKKLETIQSFSVWHRSLMKLFLDESKLQEPITEDAVAGEKILYHYIKHNGFLKEGQLIDNAHKLPRVPTVIIQGRYDMSCPPLTAWELYKKIPHARFYMIAGAGHKADEPGIQEKILEYTEIFSNL